MEPKFINQYQVTFEMAKHWAAHPVGRKAIRDRKRGICLRISLMICGVLMIFCSVLTQEYFFGFAGILAIVVGLERLFLLPKIGLKQQYAMILKSQNATEWVNKFTFSEEIICETGNTCSRYAYSDIVNVTEDSQYFYLFYNEDMVLRIYKTAFILGTADDFREFSKKFCKKQEGERE